MSHVISISADVRVGVICGVGTANSSGGPEFTPCF